MTIIGITPCNRLPDYVESVRRAGGEPRVLSMEQPPSLDGVDGLLFTGGNDIDPAHYRESPHPLTQVVDPARDTFELELAKLALAHDTPMLAVCRGLQVVNVAAGGTLIQDIESEVNEALGHQVESPLHALAHEVWVARGSALSNVMREELVDGEVLQVNSRHHQAIKQIGSGFAVSATAPDGIIEAVERPSSRFCIAVQWHPENFWRTGEFRSLFEEFVTASSK
ncbi:MAG TPA: gamma-glutamyl-gamma-aminobutyrate hydrolase family protein [Vicinamibacterales bacterium]|nr:gamma-glutamyl-gamma-aminobutyrate hydrolase family protein [Vicinamibacterales bacterium]